MVTTGENLRGVSGIYGIIHRDSERSYVGHSRNIGARLSKHKHRASHGFGGKLYNAVRKHGSESFDFEILERCPPSDLLAREKFYIQFLDSVNNGFNMAAEPERSRFGVAQSAETNAKVSAALTGRKRKPFTPEHLRKMSEATKTRMADTTVRANLSAKIKGCSHTNEARRKISESQLKAVSQFASGGEFVQTFESAGVAAEAFAGSRRTIQAAACPSAPLKTAYGFKWVYVNNLIMKERD